VHSWQKNFGALAAKSSIHALLAKKLWCFGALVAKNPFVHSWQKNFGALALPPIVGQVGGKA